ncbi:restriction endonuclease subunit S [Aeromonas veronii]|uniref:restriction endonuclease subunit S n=1 Tax=Aeromonas veronii TaxID=654 RepID=UPI003F7AB3BB
MKKGWVTKTLGEILERTETTNPTNEPDSEFHYIDVSSVSNITFSVETTQTLKGKDAPSRARKLVRENDVLFATIRPTLKRIAIVPKELDQQVCSTGYFVLRAKPEIDHRFLFYSLFTANFMGQMESLQKGASYPAVTEGEVKAQSFSFPPLPEQQRIVAILNEAFEAIAAARANAEQNRQNSRALFESYLQSVFSTTCDGWERVSLATLLERGWIKGHLDGNHGGDYPRKEEFINVGVPYISANCLCDDKIDMSRAKYLSPQRAALLRKGIAQNKDVLFAHNATVGPVAILYTDEAKVILGTSLTYYRCNQQHILSEYLAHYMRSSQFRVQYEQVMRQSTRNQVPITKQREFFHIIPPVNEQKKMIATLDGLFEKGRELEAIYQRKITALDELKQSLLQQAFSGQL